MAKQEAMSVQARHAHPFVATGIALATTGILVAVPAIAPPLTAREAQVAAEAQHALSAAQVRLAALSDDIAAALLAFQDGGPVGAVLAGIAEQVGTTTPLGSALLAFQGGGPVGAVLTPLVGADLTTAFQDGGPVGAVISAINTSLGTDAPRLSAALGAFQGGGPVGAVLAGLVGTDLTTAFQDGGPVGAVLTTLAGDNANAQAVVTAFQSGGPVGALLTAIAQALTTTTRAAGGTTALAAQQEASTPITNVAGLFGRNAAGSTGRSFLNLSTPSLAGKGDQSDPTIEANADAPKPLRAALPKPFQAVEPKAPVIDAPELPKAPVTAVRDKTDDGTKGSGEGRGLVRNSLQFKPDTTDPDTTLWGESGAGAGGWKPFQRIKDAIGRLSGGGGSLKGDGNG